MFDKNIFAQRLHALRTTQNISQQAIAIHLNIGKSAISMMEKGQRGASLEVAYALADYFGVSIDYLVGRTDKPDVNK